MNGEWYRLVGKSGTEMPTMQQNFGNCGATFPGYLSEDYPAVWEQATAKKVCFPDKQNQCAWEVDVQIANCEDFYLFKFPNVPQCDMRYCGTD
jgi:hypothetical protein